MKKYISILCVVLFLFTASVGFSSFNQYIVEPNVSTSLSEFKIHRENYDKKVYNIYQDGKWLGRAILKKLTWRGIHFENKSNSTITIQEIYIEYKIGQKTQRNITIKPMGTQYVDFKGGLRAVKQVRIVWKASKPDSKVKVYFRH